jgi:sugar phosphate permease
LRYRWAVLGAGTVAQASFSTVAFAIAVLAPALREEYDLSLTEIGVVLAAEWIGLTFALLPWGFAVDRWGERWTLAGGLAACSLFLAGAAFAPSFGWLVVLLGLAGVAGGSVQSGSGRAVMRWFAARERGLALGIRQTAVPLGGAVAALALPQLETPRAGLLFVAGFVLTGAVAGALVLRAGTEEHLDATDVEITLRDRRLWLACWGSGLYLIAQVAMMGFVVLFLHDERGFSTGEAAAVFAVGQALAAVLRIAVGRWSDVLGSRVRPLRWTGVAVAGTLGAVAVLTDAASWLLVPALALATGMSMAWNGLSYTIAAELGGRRSGAAIGFQQTVLSAIGVAAPVAFAAAVSETSWGLAFALAAVFPLAGAWLLRPLARAGNG